MTNSVSIIDGHDDSMNPIFISVWAYVLPLSDMFVLTLIELLGNLDTTLSNTWFFEIGILRRREVKCCAQGHT